MWPNRRTPHSYHGGENHLLASPNTLLHVQPEGRPEGEGVSWPQLSEIPDDHRAPVIHTAFGQQGSSTHQSLYQDHQRHQSYHHYRPHHQQPGHRQQPQQQQLYYDHQQQLLQQAPNSFQGDYISVGRRANASRGQSRPYNLLPHDIQLHGAPANDQTFHRVLQHGRTGTSLTSDSPRQHEQGLRTTTGELSNSQMDENHAACVVPSTSNDISHGSHNFTDPPGEIIRHTGTAFVKDGSDMVHSPREYYTQNETSLEDFNQHGNAPFLVTGVGVQGPWHPGSRVEPMSRGHSGPYGSQELHFGNVDNQYGIDSPATNMIPAQLQAQENDALGGFDMRVSEDVSSGYGPCDMSQALLSGFEASSNAGHLQLPSSLETGTEQSIRSASSTSNVYECDHCGKVYKGEWARGTLSRHMRMKHRDRIAEYPCQDCGKVFKRSDARLKHCRNRHP